jgi:hypothetical protein
LAQLVDNKLILRGDREKLELFKPSFPLSFKTFIKTAGIVDQMMILIYFSTDIQK